MIILEVFKINPEKKMVKDPEKTDDEVKNRDAEMKTEKIEICYFCNKKFDMNQDDSSRYKYGKYPMCDYCAEFYGFYSD